MKLKLIRTTFVYFVSLLHLLSYSFARADIRPAPSKGEFVPYLAKPTVDQIRTRLENYLFAVQQLRTHIDRTQFDLTALVESLYFDAAKIVNFVQKEIAFHPYVGSLRGAKGCLMAGAGNALDQALLLASTLKDAGFDARIVRTTLSEEQANTLLLQTRAAKERRSPFSNPAEGFAALRSAILSSGLPKEDMEKFLSSLQSEAPGEEIEEQLAAREEAEALSALIGTTLSPKAVEAKTVETLKDYFYVEHRLSPSAAWKAAHPAFHQTSDTPSSLKPEAYFKDKIPEELQHRVAVQVFIEKRTGGNLSSFPITAEVQFPTSKHAGEAFVFSSVPGNLRSEMNAEEIDQSILNSDGFFPLLNGKIAPGGEAFDLFGNRISPMAMASPMAGVIQQAGKKTAQAVSALSALGKKLPAAQTSEKPKESDILPVLLAQKLSFTLIAPGGKKTSYTRYLADRLSADKRETVGSKAAFTFSEEDFKRQLARSHTFMFSVGSLPPAYVLEKTIAELQASLPLLLTAITKHLHPKQSLRFPSSELKAVPQAWQGIPNLLTAFDTQATGANAIEVRPTPSLILHSRSLRGAKVVEESIDIVANQRRAYRITDGNIMEVPAAILQRGVWESFAEIIPLRALGRSAQSSAQQLRKARIAQSAYTKISSAKDPALSMLAPAAKAKIEAKLKAGFLIAVSNKKEARNWWEIDPQSGTTRAVFESGAGNTNAEKIIMDRIGIIMAITFGLAGLGGCLGPRMAAGASLGCCVIDAVGYGAVGFLAGKLIGLALQAVTAMIMLDMAGGYTLFVGGAMGFLPSSCSFFD